MIPTCFASSLAHPTLPMSSWLARIRTVSTTIAIDLSEDDYAGDQGEGLHVHKIKCKLTNVLYEGVEVVVLADMRDAGEDMYELLFKEGTNVARFKKPAMASAFRRDKAEVDARVLNHNRADDYIIDGRDAACVALEKKANTVGVHVMKKTFEVVFPEGYRLSQHAFGYGAGAKCGDYQIATPQIIVYRKPLGATIGGVDPATYHTQITWRFVNLAQEAQLVSTGNRGTMAVTAALAGL